MTKMEVVLYNSTVCRLCGEENDNGSLLYSSDVNNQTLGDIINSYLPVKVSDDGQLPRTICPGCTIQLEATVEFLNLITKGQKILRELYQREKDYKKSCGNAIKESGFITENILYEINTSNGIYHVEHPIALQIAGLEKPKRKRGRPPKKKNTEDFGDEEPMAFQKFDATIVLKEEPTPGKRQRKTPTRFKEAVQGKELERIFIEEGVIDEEDSENDNKPDINIEQKYPVPKEPEVIGHMENSGELVVVVKGKGRGRPKGSTMQVRESVCAQCGASFSCAGRYMAHVAQHTRPPNQQSLQNQTKIETTTPEPTTDSNDLASVEKVIDNVMNSNSLPDLNPLLPDNTTDPSLTIELKPESTGKNEEVDENAIILEEIPLGQEEPDTILPDVKPRIKCNHCDKTFASKQSKSLHIKATHQGDRPHECGECGARFAYPRSLALHAVSHRKTRAARGYACDLCGKVLNHPSSVVYHKEAEHAGQRYVCNKCGKCFKHKQLLQRHQLVHSQLRPFTCKVCPASFKTKANLVNHQLLHSGIKKFACEICKQRFAHKTSLTLHMRWHTGQKPFTCSVCGKSFSQKGNLSEHARIHTGEKPYACSLCPRRFTTSSQHRLHARRHVTLGRNHQRFPPQSASPVQRREAASGAVSGASAGASGGASAARRHECGECGRSFSERWALAKHLRRHTGERPYRCPHCPRAFADCSNLNKHKKQVHKQMSLLVNGNRPPAVAAPGVEPPPGAEPELQERVIYVTYDVDAPHSPAYHILEPEQAASLNNGKMLTTCDLYSGTSLLVQHSDLEQQAELVNEPALDQFVHKQEGIVVKDEHIAVTDEQGNPLHFTMQDGTQLAITSVDGKSLQVVTQDGQTIPVEINGFEDEEVEQVETPEAIVQQLSIQKTMENSAAPVTHYFTIV